VTCCQVCVGHQQRQLLEQAGLDYEHLVSGKNAAPVSRG
jgi:hypothetical protein